jgi:hypothetical protein
MIVIVLLGLVPSVMAPLVDLFIGNFIGGHIFLTAGLAAVLGDFCRRRRRDRKTAVPGRVHPVAVSPL